MPPRMCYSSLPEKNGPFLGNGLVRRCSKSPGTSQKCRYTEYGSMLHGPENDDLPGLSRKESDMFFETTHNIHICLREGVHYTTEQFVLFESKVS